MKFKKKPEQQQSPEEKTELTKEESKSKRIANGIINGVLIVAIVLAAICTYVSFVSTSGNGVPSILGVQILSIQTDSMSPTLLAGDLIVDTAVKDVTSLRVGDIITYWTTINGERVLNTHRINEIYNIGDGDDLKLVFQTKGDNNTSADTLTVHQSSVVGKYAFRIKGLGKAFDYLQTSTGFLLIVVIPVFLFFIYHLVQFFRVLFEYQNVKNRIKYEVERGTTEDLIAQHELQKKQEQEQARAQIEAELRERLRAEILQSMAAEKETAAPPDDEQPAQYNNGEA